MKNPEWPLHSVQGGWSLLATPTAQDGTGSTNTAEIWVPTELGI